MTKGIEKELEAMFNALARYKEEEEKGGEDIGSRQRVIRAKRSVIEDLGKAFTSAAKAAVDSRVLYESSGALREKLEERTKSAIQRIKEESDCKAAWTQQELERKCSEEISNMRRKVGCYLEMAEKITQAADADKLRDMLEEVKADAEAAARRAKDLTENAKAKMQKVVEDTRLEMQTTAKAGEYGAALQGALEIIKAQGIDLSAEQIVEVVKAVTEYQCKVVEAKSYKDWIETRSQSYKDYAEIKTNGYRGR